MVIYSKFLVYLNDALQKIGGSLYFVGGVVRDELLNIETKDIDVVVTGISKKLFEITLSSFCKVNLVGKSFGVYKCFQDGYEIDIAFPRKEFSIGDGHCDFSVDQGPHITLEEDLLRRDFTINAIAKNLETGEIVDPYGGRNDLQRRVLKQLSENSIKEDYLRALRAIQFVSRFGFDIEEKTLNSMRKHCRLIDTISLDRVSVELRKFFKGMYLAKAIEYLKDIKILEFFYKNISREQWEKIESFNKQEMYDEVIVLVMYLNFIQNNKLPSCLKLDRNTEYRLKILSKYLSTKIENKFEIKGILSVFDWHDFERLLTIKNYLGFLNKEETQIIKNILLQIKEGKEPYLLEHLAVDGNDLEKLGLKGKQVGDTLKKILKEVIMDPSMNNKEYLLRTK